MRYFVLSMSLLFLAACPPKPAETADPREAQAQQGPLPTSLSNKQLQLAMSKLNPQIKTCFDKNQMPGKVEIDLVLGGDGRFKAITPIRWFEKTNLGACIKEVLRVNEFPHFTGDDMAFTYPFLLLPPDMSASKFTRTLARLRHRAKQCAKGSTESGEINIQFVISSGGSTEIIKSSGSLLSSPIATCIRQIISSTEFPGSTDETKMNEQFSF